ncbi:phosphotransferase enzyme family protein [Cochlodiniinecator piscidefendens]|uniref:phosphotransferase enzyme family protein n=1 Tax=Cochlodiniinecator piscidefendens TaxID=2715756 RepID=UPI00140BFE56|nr:homoserine kinase [Cochlodiniinecator piscidefendens]
MKGIVGKALRLWGLSRAEWTLVAARENHVYRVDLDGNTYALRLHRKQLRTNAELRSELQWMNELGAGGLIVPKPVPAADGAFLQLIDGVQVDVLTWLRGAPVGATGQGLAHADRQKLFVGIGREMAQLHSVSDAWVVPTGFTRWSWDRKGLVGETPLWGRFWENPTLDAKGKRCLEDFRNKAQQDLGNLENNLDFGLIHADLVRENVMLDGDKIQLIDFDDAGFGYRLFDVATTLIKNRNEQDYEQLKAALLAGYRQKRALDTQHLNLFMALRATTYVGWIVSRMNEDGSAIRNVRFIEAALELVEQYLENSG